MAITAEDIEAIKHRRFAYKDDIDIPHYKPLVGSYYHPGSLYSSYATQALLPLNTLRASIILIQRRSRWDRIGLYNPVAGGVGAEGRLGIYNCDPATYYPTSLLVDAGAVSLTAAASVERTINVTLERGWYFLAWVTNDATISGRYEVVSLSPMGDATPSNIVDQGWAIVQAYGALPDPFPAGAARDEKGWNLCLRLAELL